MHVNINEHLKMVENDFDVKDFAAVEGYCMTGQYASDYNLFYDTMMAKMTKKYDKIKVIRALILMCQTNGGIK